MYLFKCQQTKKLVAFYTFPGTGVIYVDSHIYLANIYCNKVQPLECQAVMLSGQIKGLLYSVEHDIRFIMALFGD